MGLGLRFEDFPKSYRERIPEWESGELQPTYRQLSMISKKLLRPTTFFVREGLPQEEQPIVSFRRLFEVPPTYGLLKEISECESRRTNYLLTAKKAEVEVPPFPASGDLAWRVEEAADEIRNIVGDVELPNPDEAVTKQYGRWRVAIGNAGVLVFQSTGIDLKDFRGIAVHHERAPIILINPKDVSGGRTFTLLHELAHLWLGKSDFSKGAFEQDPESVEAFCNAVAAELLMPKDIIEAEGLHATSMRELSEVARFFGASNHAMAIRLANLNRAPSSLIGLTSAVSKRATNRRQNANPNFHSIQYYRYGPTYTSMIVGAAYSNAITRAAAARMLNADHSKIDSYYDRMGDL